jgi:hypothetical protein
MLAQVRASSAVARASTPLPGTLTVRLVLGDHEPSWQVAEGARQPVTEAERHRAGDRSVKSMTPRSLSMRPSAMAATRSTRIAILARAALIQPRLASDQEGHDPLPGDANHGEHPERDQGKQRQGRGRVRLGVEGEQRDHGAEEFVGVGHEWDGVALGWAELIVWSASRPGRRRATGPGAGSTALYDRGRPHQAQAPLPHNSGLTSHWSASSAGRSRSVLGRCCRSCL